MSSNGSSSPPASSARLSVAVLVGLAGCLLIWVVSPLNNFLIRNAYIADSYLPPVALAVLLPLILLVNPLLYRYRPQLALSRSQLALALGMMLVACTLPGQGLMRFLPHMLARNPVVVSQDARLAEMYEEMQLPPSLFPEECAYGADTPYGHWFITQLPDGESIPWHLWLGPLLSWGAFLMACYMMMIGLALIVYPQWRNNERLSFPLLGAFREMIEQPEEGKMFAPLFRKRSFWAAALGVLLLYMLIGANQYWPESVPAIPVEWWLGAYFSEEPLRHLPWHIHSNRIYFIFVGVAFFMPNRIGFSIWFFILAYAVHQMIAVTYMPPYQGGIVREHRMGAMLALTVAVLWLGRAHWAHVARCVMGRVQDAEDRRDRASGWLFLAGCLLMFLWLLWVGVRWEWSAFLVGYAFITTLIITRLVAETGMPFIRLDFGYQLLLVRMAPFHWLDPVTIWFSYVFSVIFQLASRVSCAVLAVHAVGLDEDATPRRQTATAWMLLISLPIGIVVCGGTHVWMGYNHSMSLDGIETPISSWGIGRLDPSNAGVVELATGRQQSPPGLVQPSYNQWFHLGLGAAMAAGLQWMCLLSPRWPLHPVGLLMVNTFYSTGAWASVFIGWLLKIMILRYGGVHVYRAARPVALGLIMGEVFAVIFFGIEPAIRVLFDIPYLVVQIQPY